MNDVSSFARRARAALTGLLLSSGLVGTVHADSEERDDNEFRQDVLLCEDAVAHAIECCPGIAAPDNACHYHRYDKEESCGCSSTGSGGSSHAYSKPVLTIDESTRIAETSCSELRSDDGCDETAKLLARPHTDVGSTPRSCK